MKVKPAASKPKAKAKPKAKPKATPKAKAKAKPQAKPKAWLKARPNGCSKCRYMAGCTPSCWLGRGGPPRY